VNPGIGITIRGLDNCRFVTVTRAKSMNTTRAKTKVEAIANVTVILMALAVGCVVLTRYVESSRTPRMVATGDHVAELPGLDWSQHRRTLLLVLNTGCHFCQDSVPFYQQLAQAQRLDRDALEMVAVFPNEADAVREFTAREGLTIRSVPGVLLENLRVNATPTLLLLNNEGRVERLWVGILTSRQEIDLLKLASGS
jgi:thiol-disulfide isomerase/thioredoxin